MIKAFAMAVDLGTFSPEEKLFPLDPRYYTSPKSYPITSLTKLIENTRIKRLDYN